MGLGKTGLRPRRENAMKQPASSSRASSAHAAPASAHSRAGNRWFKAWQPTRESRDTLFLLAVVGWVVLMQMPHMPGLISGFCLGLLAWRAWLTMRQKPLPTRWVRIGLLVLAIGITASQFRTIFGREAGSALILLLLALKTLELKAQRDAFVIFFLGFFTLLSHFLFSQSLLTAVGILAGVLALLTALVNAHMPAGYPPLRKALGTALRMALLGAPIMLALFVLFPRFAPLWGLPGNDKAKTGLSNDMTVGNIAELAQDDSIAFRVRFAGEAPPRSAMYYRGPVLGRLDGQKWTGSSFPRMPANRQAQHAPTGPEAAPEAGSAADTVRYEVLLQPHHMQWLLTLDIAVEQPTLPAGWRALQMASMEWTSHRPITDVLRYQASSRLNYHADASIPAPYLRPYLALPPGLNPRTRELAQRFLNDPKLANSTPAEQIQAVLYALRHGDYRYTLAPGLTGEHAADTFWFDSKEGFCEHIANAFVVLMRNMRIPARIVTGYQGGELNPMDGMWTVRQSDAHAWAEVWLEGRGWVRIDPTASVSPSRVEDLARLQSRGAVGTAIETVSPGLAGVLQRSLQSLRNVWDATNTRWNSWVLNYTQDRQFDLLRSLGFSDVSWTTLARLLAFALAGLALLGSLWAWREKRQHDPWLRLLQQARTRLQKMGVPVPESPALTPRQLLQLLEQHTAAAAIANTITTQAEPPALAAWRNWLLGMEAVRYAPSASHASPTAASSTASSAPATPGSRSAGKPHQPHQPLRPIRQLKSELRRLPPLAQARPVAAHASAPQGG